MTLDVKKIRNDFPALHQNVNGYPLIYFDNGATSQKPQCVIDKIVEFYKNYNANAHRGVHYLSDKTTEELENARNVVQSFINAKHNHEIIFTKGTTEGINMIAKVFEETFLKEGDEIIVTEMEHHSNFLPWQLACLRKNAKLKIIPFDNNGNLQIEKIETLITEKTKIIAINHISNVLGTQNPVKKIITLAHKYEIPVLIDAAQSIVHTNIDVQELDCDFLAFSGHKIYGPTGIGVLYGKEHWLEKLPPWQSGGEMIESVSINKSTFNKLPFKFEAGTSNLSGAIALGEAISYLKNIGLNNIFNYEHDLGKYLRKKFESIDEITIYGNNPTSSLVSFNINGIHHYDFGMMLDKLGIAIRTGHLCAEIIMQHYDVKGMIRASLAFYNTHEEVDRFYDNTKKVLKMFQ